MTQVNLTDPTVAYREIPEGLDEAVKTHTLTIEAAGSVALFKDVDLFRKSFEFAASLGNDPILNVLLDGDLDETLDSYVFVAKIFGQPGNVYDFRTDTDEIEKMSSAIDQINAKRAEEDW